MHSSLGVDAPVYSFQQAIDAKSKQAGGHQHQQALAKGLTAQHGENFGNTASLVGVKPVRRQDKKATDNHEHQPPDHQPKPADGIDSVFDPRGHGEVAIKLGFPCLDFVGDTGAHKGNADCGNQPSAKRLAKQPGGHACGPASRAV